MQQIVYNVAGYEASPFFYRSLRLECELSCEIEIAKQTDQIAYSIGNIKINDQFQQQVDSIMDDCRYASYDCKSDELNSNQSVTQTFNSADLHRYVCKGLYRQRRCRQWMR